MNSFFEAIFEFRKDSIVTFDHHIGLNLKAVEYEVYNRDNNLSPQSTFFKVLHYLDTQSLRHRSYLGCNSITMFIRNVHHYFKDHD
jgi:hypothetical protein